MTVHCECGGQMDRLGDNHSVGSDEAWLVSFECSACGRHGVLSERSDGRVVKSGCLA